MPTANGKTKVLEIHTRFENRDKVSQGILHLPRLKNPSKGMLLADRDAALMCSWATAPTRPAEGLEPSNDLEALAVAAMDNVQFVRSRIRDVEIAMADPANLWTNVAERWGQAAEQQTADMDTIVRHTRYMPAILQVLSAAPRKVLSRRTSKTPLSRVQEMDRQSMLWLSRQPGRNWEERAGPSQRILAPTRYENINTLENRVLRSFCELSMAVAKNYLGRNKHARQHSRYERVEHYGRTCARLARDLRTTGVSRARGNITPNYVLLNDGNYRQVWTAYQELLDRNRVVDELWAWQARSWEEFCAIAVIVACKEIPGIEIIAASPINFQEEQTRGLWLESDNPLAVFFLREQKLILEIQMRPSNPASGLSEMGAPIVIRYGDLSNEFLRRALVWPLHSFSNENPVEDAQQVLDLLPKCARSLMLKGGIVLRNRFDDKNLVSEILSSGDNSVLAGTIGPRGNALREGLKGISTFLESLVSDP